MRIACPACGQELKARSEHCPGCGLVRVGADRFFHSRALLLFLIAGAVLGAWCVLLLATRC